jgi:hypothetical protein
VKINGEQAQSHEGIEGRGDKDLPILESLRLQPLNCWYTLGRKVNGPRVGVDMMVNKNSVPTGNLLLVIRPVVSHITDGNGLIFQPFEDYRY